jgi:hypothetical protein
MVLFDVLVTVIFTLAGDPAFALGGATMEIERDGFTLSARPVQDIAKTTAMLSSKTLSDEVFIFPP